VSTRLLATACALVAAFVVTGCGDDDGAEQAAAGGASGGAVRDCVGEVAFDAPPAQAVTTDAYAAEILVALGLTDRLAGTGYPYSPEQRPSGLETEFAQVETLSEEYPTKEVILGSGAELLVSSFPSFFTTPGVSRDDLDAIGVKSYLTTSEGCPGGERKSLDPTYTDIVNLATLFGVEERGRQLVDDMKTTVGGVQEAVAGKDRPRVWAYAGEDTPYVPGNAGTPNAIIELAGGENLFADMDRAWDEVSWEEVIERDPEVVWLMTASGEGYGLDEAKGIEEKLLADERLSGVSAIKNKRFVVVSYQIAGIPSPRNAEAVSALAAGLHPDDGG
jgi:iron complex transport system substrate-binding protein